MLVGIGPPISAFSFCCALQCLFKIGTGCHYWLVLLVLLGDHIHLILPLILVFTPDRQHRHHRQFHPGEIIKLDPASHTIYVIVSPCGNPISHTNYATLCKIKRVIRAFQLWLMGHSHKHLGMYIHFYS